MSEAQTSPVATTTDQASDTARVMPSAAGADSKAPLPSAYDIPIEDILPVNPRLFNENRWQEYFERLRAEVGHTGNRVHANNSREQASLGPMLLQYWIGRSWGQRGRGAGGEACGVLHPTWVGCAAGGRRRSLRRSPSYGVEVRSWRLTEKSSAFSILPGSGACLVAAVGWRIAQRSPP